MLTRVGGVSQVPKHCHDIDGLGAACTAGVASKGTLWAVPAVQAAQCPAEALTAPAGGPRPRPTCGGNDRSRLALRLEPLVGLSCGALQGGGQRRKGGAACAHKRSRGQVREERRPGAGVWAGPEARTGQPAGRCAGKPPCPFQNPAPPPPWARSGRPPPGCTLRPLWGRCAAAPGCPLGWPAAAAAATAAAAAAARPTQTGARWRGKTPPPPAQRPGRGRG